MHGDAMTHEVGLMIMSWKTAKFMGVWFWMTERVSGHQNRNIQIMLGTTLIREKFMGIKTAEAKYCWVPTPPKQKIEDR